MNLSTHFTYEELTRSSTAERLGIDNSTTDEVAENLIVLANGLESVRRILGLFNQPIIIDSGYRCEELNTALHGAKDSAHMKGLAADFICPFVGDPLEIVNKIADSDLQFDQLIQEGTWVHISFDPRMRREVLTAHFGKDGTTYTKGV